MQIPLAERALWIEVPLGKRDLPVAAKPVMDMTEGAINMIKAMKKPKE